jgi:AmmeMemoRadiSam system protein A
MSHEGLTVDEGQALVTIARASLEAAVCQGKIYEPELAVLAPALQRPGSSFVTLTRESELRGCIGTTERRYPLAADAARNAAGAASRDYRFAPVTAAEAPQVRLEVTVLTPPRIVPYCEYEELERLLRPGIDGVILEWKERRGLLLPQVWQRVEDHHEFLAVICQKAGIPVRQLRARPPSVLVSVFQAQHFMESGYREPGD